MDSYLLPIIGIVAVVVAAIALTKLFARKPEGVSSTSAQRAAQPLTPPTASAQKSYPITTIGIPPGHVPPSASAAASRSYPITTIGIPPGHVTRA